MFAATAKYTISKDRNAEITNVLNTHFEKPGHEKIKNIHLDNLSQLVALDTNLSDAEFMSKFNQLKDNNNSQLIADLCKPKGGAWNSFKLSLATSLNQKYEVERYKTIINHLKTGISSDKVSYFGTNHELQKSFCKKIETLRANCYEKTYDKYALAAAKDLKKNFKTFTNLNNNLKYEPQRSFEINNNQYDMWKNFTQAYPEYRSLTFANQKDEKNFIINGKSCNFLREQLCHQLGLPPESLIFVDQEKDKDTNILNIDVIQKLKAKPESKSSSFQDDPTRRNQTLVSIDRLKNSATQTDQLKHLNDADFNKSENSGVHKTCVGTVLRSNDAKGAADFAKESAVDQRALNLAKQKPESIQQKVGAELTSYISVQRQVEPSWLTTHNPQLALNSKNQYATFDAYYDGVRSTGLDDYLDINNRQLTKQPVTKEAALNIVDQTVDLLRVLRQAGIVHGDLHGHNLQTYELTDRMNSTDADVVLKAIDFGNSKTYELNADGLPLKQIPMTDINYMFKRQAPHALETIRRNNIRDELDDKQLKHYPLHKLAVYTFGKNSTATNKKLEEIGTKLTNQLAGMHANPDRYDSKKYDEKIRKVFTEAKKELCTWLDSDQGKTAPVTNITYLTMRHI